MSKVLKFVGIIVLIVASFIMGAIYVSEKTLKISSWVNIERLKIDELEFFVDKNKNLWKTYSDRSIAFKYPMYFSQFNDLSSSELTKNDERVSNYFRSEYLNSEGGLVKGRSYWILLKNPIDGNITADVKAWIIKNKLDQLKVDNSRVEQMPIEEVNLGAKKGYSVKLMNSEHNVPQSEWIYFHTRDEGVRGVGFRTWSEEYLNEDYQVFKDLISELKFLN